MSERLHKYIARCGVASRRKAEEMMAEGRVLVNGEITIEPGTQIQPGKDRVEVDGKHVKEERKVYILLHKPRGVVTTSMDELERQTVLDLVEGVKQRVYPVGRLDRDSEGLLVLTNDGDLAYYLTHPSCEVTKTYRVSVDGFMTDETVDTIRKGVRVGGRKVAPRRLQLIHRNRKLSRLEIEIGEGLNREVRRIFAAEDHETRRLIRTRIGPLSIDGLPKGRARHLTTSELMQLRSGMERAGLEPDSAMRKPKSPPRGKRGAGSTGRGGKPDPRGHAGGKGKGRPGSKSTPRGRPGSKAHSEDRPGGREPSRGRSGTRSTGSGKGRSNARPGGKGANPRPGGKRKGSGTTPSGKPGRRQYGPKRK